MVQEESLKELYEECHKRFLYQDGKLIYRYDIHSKQMEGESPKKTKSDYEHICVDYTYMLVHRVIFLMHHGHLPKLVDHIDRDPSNNRIENLRDADKAINSWNRDLQSNNTSGFRGVSWNKGSGKWHAYIKVAGRRRHIGLFNTPEEASAAYEQARDDIAANEGIVTR